MTLPFFVDATINSIQGGAPRTAESIYSPDNIIDSFWEGRAIQLQEVYKKSARINPDRKSVV